MATITKTYPLTLDSTYVPNAVIEIAHFRSMNFDADERISIYLEAIYANLDIRSFTMQRFPKYNGSETEEEKVNKFYAAQNQSQKIGLQVLGRKNNIGTWDEKAEIIVTNVGRKQQLDLLPLYLAQGGFSRLLESNDALAVKLIDYGNGLFKVSDKLHLDFSLRIEIEKKNNLDATNARIEALELALAGKLTNVPANTLLGRDTGTGVIETIAQTKFATPEMLNQTIIDLVGGAPGALNTLIELAAALNNDSNFASTVTNALALKANINNPIFTGTIQISGGINFPVSQLPSTDPNTLDDYEEGVWTPTLSYQTPGTLAVAYNRNTGRYQKIGNRVSISFDLRLSSFSKGSATGSLIISGLPFAARSGGGFDNNFGSLIVGSTPYTGIPYIQTSTATLLSSVFLFKSTSTTVAADLDDPIAGAIYWGQLNYET